MQQTQLCHRTSGVVDVLDDRSIHSGHTPSDELEVSVCKCALQD